MKLAEESCYAEIITREQFQALALLINVSFTFTCVCVYVSLCMLTYMHLCVCVRTSIDDRWDFFFFFSIPFYLGESDCKFCSREELTVLEGSKRFFLCGGTFGNYSLLKLKKVYWSVF